MLWFTLSLLTAMISATEVASMKKLLSGVRPLEMVAFPLAYSLPLFLACLPFVPMPDLAPGVWTTALTLLPFNGLGLACTYWAARISPLSLTMPFQAFTPVVAVFLGISMLGEMPTLWGGLGIVVIVMGSWVLNLDPATARGKGVLLAPFRAILKERGSMLMLAAAIIYGLCAVLGKKLVLQSSPLFAGTFFFSLHNSVLLLVFLLTGRVRPRVLLGRPKAGLFVGTAMFLHVICHMFAVSMITTAYMIAIKRLNGFFSVILGRFMFGEGNMRFRMAGAGAMALGAAVIAILG